MTDHKTIPFTKAGYEKVKAEYEQLTENRPHILERLQRAREMGDLSENGMYKAARMELSDTDRRLRRLTYLVRMGRVVETSKGDVVMFGSNVLLNFNGKEVSYELVNKHESDPATGKISVESPLGKVLLGSRVGEKVVLKLPTRSVEYEVVGIE